MKFPRATGTGVFGLLAFCTAALAVVALQTEQREVAESTPLIDPHPFRGKSTAEYPSPTELQAWKQDRAEYKREREEWIETMHRSPGIDWREIERENRRMASLRRMELSNRGAPTDRWTEVGSANQAGHSRAAAANSDGTELYVGSAAGGVWHGGIDGTGWEPISDGLGLGSSQLLVVPAGDVDEPEVVFTLSTSSFYATVHATTDNGTTWWVPEGLPEVMYEWRRIALDPANPRHVYLLMRAGVRNENDQLIFKFHLLRSTDGGFNWASVYGFPSNPKCDLWIDRINGGDIYVMSGPDMYKSSNQGTSFDLVGSAGTGSVSNIHLTGSEAGGPTFYAALRQSGTWQIHRSTDAGQTWTFVHTATDMWDSITASMSDPDVVFYASVETWRSTDGGSSFSKMSDWWEYYDNVEFRLHADVRGLDAQRIGEQNAVFFNTDGGTYVSYDDGETVQNLSLEGLGIGQYYGTFTSATHPYLVAAGAQDQGYQVSEYDGSPYSPFNQWISGDYGHLTSTLRNHDLLFSTYPGFILVQRAEGVEALSQVSYPDGATSLWLPRVVAVRDPADEGDFYFVGDKLYKYERVGSHLSWTISEFANNGSGLYAGFEISPVDHDHMVAVKENGNLWRTTNGGDSWNAAGTGPDGHSWFGTSIEASPVDADIFYAAGSAYSGHAVWKTTDAGLNWSPFGTGLPETLVYEVCLGGIDGDRLFAATDAGPYTYMDGTWVSLYGTEAPITSYWSVEWVPEINSMRFGTYGRGIWDYELLSPADVAEGDDQENEGPQPRLQVSVSPNPVRGKFTVQLQMDQPGEVRVDVFDMGGRRVATVPSQRFDAGTHAISHDFERRLSTGTYFVRATTPEGVAVQKIQVRG